MVAENNLILDKNQTLQKIKRIAFEIYENNYKETELVLAGIFEKGYLFAELLKKELENISKIKVSLVKITLDKNSRTQSQINLDVNIDSLKNKTVIVTDDVINTGRAITYSLQPFLNLELKKLQTAVIVDRHHQLFPIAADYIGYSLATTIKEHIEVNFEEGSFGVYLH